MIINAGFVRWEKNSSLLLVDFPASHGADYTGGWVGFVIDPEFRLTPRLFNIAMV